MHIVLVEPSRAVQSAVKTLLQPAGHAVSAFDDACEALERIKTDEEIDGVITAAELTPMSGVELCWEVRLVAGEHRPIYIALMSSNLEGRTAIEALDVGVDDLLQKPPEKQELYAKLRSGERLLTLQRKLIRLATTDPLTGLLNRRAFFERATEACANASADRNVAAILLDIDYFKEVNDLYGHQTGDEALRAVASEVGKEQSIVGRLGGDELCILLKDCTQADALKAAEKLRARISGLSVNTSGGKATLTCSLGVSELGSDGDVDDLIKNADLALYRAKREGRDCAASPPPPVWLESNPRATPGVARSARRDSGA
jgi:two-component system cell cycle response regulator